MTDTVTTDAPAVPASSGNVAERRMLEALICPRSQGPLRYDAARQELISETARLAFPIRDGIPIVLVSEARVLE